MLDSQLIYVVDDDVSIANLIFQTLKHQGYRVKVFHSGRDLLEAWGHDSPDLVILDIMMPAMNGMEVAGRLRRTSNVPIMMLSVRDDVAIKATALDGGADDYLTKPFEVAELLARVRAILRRSLASANGHSSSTYRSGDLVINLESGLVAVGGVPVKLTPHEWAVLRTLAQHVGQVVTPRQLLQEVWGPDYGDEGDYVRTYVTRLRRKLEPDPKKPRYILLDWGFGYHMAEPRNSPEAAFSYNPSPGD